MYASDILAPQGLTHGTGIVGVSTRAKLQQVSMSTTGTVPPPPTNTITPLIQLEGDIKVDELKKKVDDLRQQLQSIQNERNVAMAAVSGVEGELKDSKQDVKQLKESIRSYESGYGRGALITLETVTAIVTLVGLVSAVAYLLLKRGIREQVRKAHEDMVRLSKARTGASVYNFLSQTFFNYYYDLYLATKTIGNPELLHAVHMSVALSSRALDLARDAQDLSNEIEDNAIFITAMNSYAFHLAVYRYSNDSEEATEAQGLAKKIYVHAEEIRHMPRLRKSPFYPEWYDLLETYVRVMLAYSEDMEELKKAVEVYEKLYSNDSLPEEWLKKPARPIPKLVYLLLTVQIDINRIYNSIKALGLAMYMSCLSLLVS